MKNENILKIENATNRTAGVPISDPPQLPTTAPCPSLAMASPTLSANIGLPPTPDLPSTPEAQAYLARLSSARVNSVLRLSRIGSTVRQLKEGQLTKLILWLHQHPTAEVQRMAAAPPPDGFGLNIHYTTLHRLKNKLDAGDLADELERLTDLCHDASEQVGELDLDNVRSVIGGLVYNYVRQAIQNTGDPSQVAKLVDSVAKLSAIEHKSQKLALDREKLHAQINAGAEGAGPARTRIQTTQLQQVNLNIVPPVPLNRSSPDQPEKNQLPPTEPSETPVPFHQIADNRNNPN